MMRPPTVSVVVPVYNAAPFLDQALQSIRGQKLEDIEIICIDDGSTDGSERILERHAAQDKRLTVFRQSNRGAGSARNIGLRAVRGEYVWFPDADDFFHAEFLERAVTTAQADHCDLVVVKSKKVDVQTGEEAILEHAANELFLPLHLPYRPLDFPDTIYQPFNGWAWDKLFSRELVERSCAVFQEIRTTNDLHFVLSCLTCARRVTLVRDVLVTWRVGNLSSLSATRAKSWNCAFDSLIHTQRWLQERELYTLVRKSFINLAAEFLVWNIFTLPKEAADDFRRALADKYLSTLEIVSLPSSDFYNPDHLRLLLEVTRTRSTLLRSSESLITWLQSLKRKIM